MTATGDGAPVLGAAKDVSRQNLSGSSVMDGSSSSKVTVEYHDPSGLFPLVQEQLSLRLPLRNLHWKSPNRPLRSIDSLHVDLVPSKDSVHISGVTSPGLAPPEGLHRTSSSQRMSGPTSSEIIRPPSKERRHQIPGLRQTPYLKIYLLRCDDSDTYKSTARKQLREWVKTHTPPSQSSSSSSTQENHDAFEWMILHVVIPDTPAASQPRGTASSGAATGEKEKSSTTSRWTRGTTTILEKIRADFNISSKSAPDRVAQVRLQKDAVPPHMLPSTSTATSPPINESPQEQEKVWNDVIVKFKTLILLSFDLRVSQYEEDIREKDSQRALPGWNFCTFFILKEGLAKGFESVGLVEDALLGYDELSIGLDTIVRDQSDEGGQTQGGAILNYSEDIHERASEILKRSQKDDGGRKEPQAHLHDEKPISSQKKNYRDLILSNNISIFDFRSYVFARQMSLLLRLGNARSTGSDLAAKLQPRPNTGVLQRSVDDVNVGTKHATVLENSEDLLSLAELCSRAIHFITSASRLLRDDLLNGAIAHETTFPKRLVDNLVRSWTFAALQQLLDETATSSLPISKFSKDAATSSSGKMRSFGNHSEELKVSVAEPKTMIHPTRSTSLNYGRSASADPPYAQPTSTGQVVFADGQYQDRPVPAQESIVPQAKSGLQELAAARAQLYVVERRILEHVGKSMGWNIGWAAIISSRVQKEDFRDVDLNRTSNDEEGGVAGLEAHSVTSPTVGLSAAQLVSGVSSIDQFRESYEKLSDLIVKHYMAAGQVKSGEGILGDLAALRFELGDFAAAAMYFGRMASLFSESRWNYVETTMLKMYAQCLKKLNRKDEYVRTLLNLLAKSAAHRMSLRSSLKRGSSSDMQEWPKEWLNDDKVDTTGVFSDLVEFSEHIPYDRTVPMTKYFGDIIVEPYVRHFDEKDGFQLRLQFRHVLEDEIEIERAKVQLISATSAQGKEIWLESSGTIKLKKGICRIWLGSNVNTTGPYMVDKIVIEAKRIIFIHEPFRKAEATTPLGITTSVSATSLKAAKKSRVLCFPRVEAFQARVYLSHFIHIDRPRSVEIECRSGWNDMQRAEIRLRSASAGLRLRTANTTVTSGEVTIEDKPNPGVIDIASMAPDTTATFRVPYELEQILPELSIKLEVVYFTDKGEFQYYSSFIIPIELPLDVNVHDHFKNESLYSKFNIKTANHVPLEILDVGLEESEEFGVFVPKRIKDSTLVFPKQPLSVTYKITKKPVDPNKRRQSRNPNTGSLALSVEYRCMNEDVLARVCELFATAVENSQVHRLGRLLIATFTDRLEHRILPHQYEKIALLDKVDMGTFEDMGWAECIDSLPHIIRGDTEKWLRNWHENNGLILLSTTPKLTSSVPGIVPPSPHPSRRIIITVSIPQTHILHTASLFLESPEQAPSHSTAIAVVGQPLLTELCIKHTRRWGWPSALVAAANLKSSDDAMDFVYSIEANPDVWLVAGQRRAQFTAKEGEEKKLPIILIPLKPGNVLLPNVEIRARVAPKGEQKGQSEELGQQLNCETDYLSYGECVMVVPDVRSSTIGIGEMASPRSVVWLESESRI
ncbi:TMEM1 family protein-like protein [Lindgomyces ingoldianus]|uniref:TMEM1 family protein-like protein n=1 Tax=Lindgomyces ingoldianus TaxID=673940 RepID=A0ACB6QWD2_9PLEO|nr:TMEM1 family protein-like protein [Lindgomyces ingoldianus]KAF2471313.1 TMEM1 family protein-like protein [Lindgomyces ingoldianus]